MRTNFKFILLICLFFGIHHTWGQDNAFRVDQTYTGVNQLFVRGVFAEVYIEGYSGDETQFVGEILGDRKHEITIEHRLANGKLEIWVETPNKIKWNNKLKGNISIRVPKNLEAEIRNSSGNISIKSFSSDKTLVVRASSGDINIDHVNADVELVASSGDVQIDQHKGDLELKTSSGNQEITDLSGNIKIVASSGDVEISDIMGDMNLLTSSGNISIEHAKGKCKLKSSSGDIKAQRLTLTANSNFITTSGYIRIDFENALHDLSFDLNSSSGTLRVGSEKSEKRLLLKEGKILVEGVSTSGDQSYN